MTADQVPPGDGGGRQGEPLLRVEGVARHFAGFRAVGGVSFVVRPGEIVGLIGPNGAGKSTLFNVVSRFLAADAGQIWFRGRRIDGLPPHAVTALGLVRTFQISRVFARMTVHENLAFAARGQRGEGLVENLVRPGAVREQEALNAARADELIRYFNLARVRDTYAGALSGGQRKLLELARALMTEPSMALLDEPMAGVNPALKAELLHYILDLRQRGLTVVVVEHDIDLIMRICDRVLVLAYGELIADDTPERVRTNPAVIDAYLGSA